MGNGQRGGRKEGERGHLGQVMSENECSHPHTTVRRVSKQRASIILAKSCRFCGRSLGAKNARSQGSEAVEAEEARARCILGTMEQTDVHRHCRVWVCERIASSSGHSIVCIGAVGTLLRKVGRSHSKPMRKGQSRKL